MHNNYYFLKQLTSRLRTQLTGWELISCFSQNKNELVIGFIKSAHEFYIRAALNPDFSCLSFPETFHRSKKNSVELFLELIGKKCIDIYQFENERSFSLIFEEDYNLLFKLHGNRSNILLFHKGELLYLFKNKLKKDRELKLSDLDNPLDQSFENFMKKDQNHKALFPTFGKVVNQYLESNHYYEKSPEGKWELLQKIIDQLDHPDYFVTTLNDKLTFSLLSTGSIHKAFKDPVEGINSFFYTYTRHYQLDKEKREILSKLKNAYSRSGNYLIKTRQQLEQKEKEDRYEEIANIIMANLHNIQAGTEKVELFDFYREKPVVIKLKRDLTPQKNAEIFYRKAKNKKIETDNLSRNIHQKEKEMLNQERHIQNIEAIDDIRELRKYITQHHLKRTKKEENIHLPYRRFLIDDFDVLVGKSARHNDELTQKYTKKDDLWLHAKDVPGSHVVIKNKPGHPFPSYVIERAAQLAAYYSKRKTDTLCPVVYTSKKYIFKPKGSKPGEVVLQREEVVMVEPAKD